MFTFCETTPENTLSNLDTSFQNIFQSNPSLFHFFNDEKSISIQVSSSEGNVVSGGALLVQKSLQDLPPKMRTAMTSFATSEGKVWLGTVHLHLENTHSFPEFEPYCKAFYQKLYESLVDFGQHNEARFLSMILVPGEYLSTEVIGLWPYVLEVKPHETRDGLFHGVLSLSKAEPLSPTLVWQTLLPEIHKLAA